MIFDEKLAAHASAVNVFLQSLLEKDPAGAPKPFNLGDAMRYAALDGGKRFRPFLVIETASLFDVALEEALPAAAAIECVHCYSLIHDDLPSMDDDVTRRGRPTVHVQFDEATAILAGDALQSLAFEILADPKAHPDGSVRSLLIARLARASGAHGMAGGQDLDLRAVHQPLGADQVRLMQRMKTGALIEWACEAGAFLGNASASEGEALVDYARAIGLGFQVADDLLDVEGSEADVGKGVGKDLEAGKATLIAELGVDGARKLLSELEAAAIDSLSQFGVKATALREAAHFVTNRTY